MPVVARHRAHEPDLVLLAPRPLRVDRAEEHHPGEAVAHDGQAGVAAGDHLLGLDPQQLGEHLPQLAQSLEPAVVAYVDPAGVLGRRRQAQQVVGEVELLGRRLAPGQVELETPRLQLLVGSPLLVEQRGEVVGGQVGQRSRVHGSSLEVGGPCPHGRSARWYAASRRRPVAARRRPAAGLRRSSGRCAGTPGD